MFSDPGQLAMLLEMEIIPSSTRAPWGWLEWTDARAMGLAMSKGALDWLLLWWVTLRRAFELQDLTTKTGFPGEATGSLLGLRAEPLFLEGYPIDIFLGIRRWSLGPGPDVRNP